MIPPHSVIRLRIVCILILTLLAMVPAKLFAIQIAPNPNPDGNTITITPSTPRENLVPFTNLGTINIESQASFHNSSQFNNGSPLPFTFGGGVTNSGTIINSDRFINNRRVSLLEGSQFINLPSGFYYNAGGTLIDGTFVNKGTVDHNGISSFSVSGTGQYIQRQDPNSSVTPTTISRDQVFRNAGLVHIAAGEFSIRPFGGYVQTGTTQIDGVFHNSGRVFNDGHIAVGTSGLYEHQIENAFPGPGPNPGGLTSNTGIFSNAGTTNIATGVFQNQGSVVNSGTFTVGTAGTYNQTSASGGVTPTTVNSGTFANVGTTNINTGVFENRGGFVNAGIINIQPSASLSNSSRFENSGLILSAGTITNSDIFINSRVGVSLLEGSQFNNLASGRYSGDAGSIHINGTFVNEGAVDHINGQIVVEEKGQFIQRQAVGSNVTPTTITPDAPFTNAGRVHIGAGDFRIDPISLRAASASYFQTSTGTTQIDARFQNIGGTVVNAGAITIGATGEYRQEGLPGPILAGSTSNTGTFTNAGTTNIATGVFQNQGSVANSGTFIVGAAGTYSQTSSSASITPTTVNTGNFGNRGTTNIDAGNFENGRVFSNTGMTRIGEGATFRNTDTGLYNQPPGTTTKIDGSFINKFAMQNGGAITVSTTGSYSQVAGTSFGTGTGNGGTFTNAGQVHIGEGTTFNSFVVSGRPWPSGQYVQQASGTTRIDGVFDNRGSVKNEGAITVGATGQYLQSRGDTTALTGASTTNSGTFTNAGTVRIGEGTSFSNFPTLAPGSSSPVGGQYIQQAGGRTQIDGSFSNQGGRVTNEGVITVGATGTYNQTRSSAPVPATPATANIGIFTNAGNTLVNAGTFTNHGILVNSGSFQIGGNGVATLTNYSTMINAGTFEVGIHGGVSGPGSYSQVAHEAQTIVNGTFGNTISLQAGSLSGTGTVTGAVTNTVGVVQPGTSLVPGTLTLANYTQGIYGRLDLKIGGLLAGSQYDVLKVTGPAAFGGNLSVRLINGFTPGLGNTFNLLACSLGCAGLNGGSLFSGAVLLPSLASGLAWLSGLTDGGNGFSLTVVAAAASAPEPGMLLLVGSGCLGLIMWRRRQQGHTIGQ
ncbi:MAG: PEP-CTERM sorting domain-containing protein [Nitrospira sp.]